MRPVKYIFHVRVSITCCAETASKNYFIFKVIPAAKYTLYTAAAGCIVSCSLNNQRDCNFGLWWCLCPGYFILYKNLLCNKHSCQKFSTRYDESVSTPSVLSAYFMCKRLICEAIYGMYFHFFIEFARHWYNSIYYIANKDFCKRQMHAHCEAIHDKYLHFFMEFATY